jgi:hypothetical protein
VRRSSGGRSSGGRSSGGRSSGGRSSGRRSSVRRSSVRRSSVRRSSVRWSYERRSSARRSSARRSSVRRSSVRRSSVRRFLGGGSEELSLISSKLLAMGSTLGISLLCRLLRPFNTPNTFSNRSDFSTTTLFGSHLIDDITLVRTRAGVSV